MYYLYIYTAKQVTNNKYFQVGLKKFVLVKSLCTNDAYFN